MGFPTSYSPASHHRRLARDTPPELHYRGGDLDAWRRALKRKLGKLLGDTPRERVPLRPKTIWHRQHPLGTIEKVVFTSEANADLPAYVCLPAGSAPPYTFAIALQGHSTGMHNSIGVAFDDETQTIEVAGDRDFALGCMRNGIAALCIEQRAFGEREERLQEVHSSERCETAAVHALMLGRTLLGERVYDVDRAIDYILSRGDAHPRRIGVMGNSGGGTTSLFAAAMLPRLAFAMPSGYFCTFKDSIMAMHHCVCNYVPGLLKIAEMSDIAGLIAPRPVVMVSGLEDPIFPIAGARRAFRHLRTIYAAHGATPRCHHIIGNGGHRFYAADAWPTMLKEIAKLP